MQVAAHLVISWFSAEAAGLKRPRDRRIVALSGVAPDIDAVAYPAAYLWFGFDLDRAYAEVWEPVHHHYTHGIGFALLTGGVAWWLARAGPEFDRKPFTVAVLACLVSLAHVFCDVVGAGPGWPVFPLWPISEAAWSVSWSWNVSDWPNSALTFSGLAMTLIYARVAGRSPVESISTRLDGW
ncbi:MAG: metal-dependent hydrolase, partial [Gammaproteobacteria bacterium]|nr:metal-dependent hydrolase [Gammaproteobacteria bacterium]